MATRQLCTFWVGDLLFGVDVGVVQEVIRFQDITRVPMAPREIRGLINLRGQIVTAVDLRCRLELDPLEGKRPMNVVLRTPDGVVSLLVDQIGDVLEVEEDLHEHPPETLDGVARTLVRGVYKLHDHLLLVLDCEAALRFTVAAQA